MSLPDGHQCLPNGQNGLPTGHQCLPDDIHDTLFKLVEVDKKRKRNTKKARGERPSKKNTRKNKNE
jgi:hypothetical protein